MGMVAVHLCSDCTEVFVHNEKDPEVWELTKSCCSKCWSCCCLFIKKCWSTAKLVSAISHPPFNGWNLMSDGLNVLCKITNNSLDKVMCICIWALTWNSICLHHDWCQNNNRLYNLSMRGESESTTYFVIAHQQTSTCNPGKTIASYL